MRTTAADPGFENRGRAQPENLKNGGGAGDSFLILGLHVRENVREISGFQTRGRNRSATVCSGMGGGGYRHTMLWLCLTLTFVG